MNHLGPWFQLKIFFTVLLKNETPTSCMAWGWTIPLRHENVLHFRNDPRLFCSPLACSARGAAHGSSTVSCSFFRDEWWLALASHVLLCPHKSQHDWDLAVGWKGWAGIEWERKKYVRFEAKVTCWIRIRNLKAPQNTHTQTLNLVMVALTVDTSVYAL